MRRSAIAAALFTSAATLVPTASAVRADSPPCRGSQLGGSFAAIPGSPGAGHISYRLVIRNTSKSTCFVSGIPTLTLIGKLGKALPTTARPEFPGELAEIRIDLNPGKAARLDARFSPDVPGPGEQQMGACERVATRLRVVPNGGGSTLVPLTPPTSVCEHGAMSLTLLSRV